MRPATPLLVLGVWWCGLAVCAGVARLFREVPEGWPAAVLAP
ncbi:hypothetical protein [Actinomadura bangladeshensis]|nr:hypothetical protein [Actinomadura bangladeshensis]